MTFRRVESADLIRATAALTGWSHRHHDRLKIDFFERGSELIAVGYDDDGGINVAGKGHPHSSRKAHLDHTSPDKDKTVLGWLSDDV